MTRNILNGGVKNASLLIHDRGLCMVTPSLVPAIRSVGDVFANDGFIHVRYRCLEEAGKSLSRVAVAKVTANKVVSNLAAMPEQGSISVGQ